MASRQIGITTNDHCLKSGITKSKCVKGEGDGAQTISAPARCAMKTGPHPHHLVLLPSSSNSAGGSERADEQWCGDPYLMTKERGKLVAFLGWGGSDWGAHVCGG